MPASFTLRTGAAMAAALACALAGCDAADTDAPPACRVRVDRLARPASGPREAAVAPEADWVAYPGHGYIRAAAGDPVWLRIRATNPAVTEARPAIADAEYHTDSWEIFLPDDRGGWRVELAGEAVPAARKNHPGRAAGAALPIPAGGTLTAYARVSDALGADFRPVIHADARAWRTAEYRGAVIESAYFGLVLTLMLYGLVFHLWLHRNEILAYCGYLAGLGIFMAVMRGVPAQFDLPLHSPASEVLLSLSLAFAAASLGRFAQGYLRLGERATRLLRLGAIAVAVGGATGLLTPWVRTPAALGVCVATVSAYQVTLLAVAVIALRAGVARARWFILSQVILLAGSTPLVIAWFFSADATPWFGVALAASALELLLLAFVIAEDAARERGEKLEAQARAIAEAESRRVMQDAYADELENEVRERTREI